MTPEQRVKIAEAYLVRIDKFLHDFILDANPRTPDAINYVNEMIDLKDALKKLYNRYRSSMSEIIGDL